MTRVSRWIQGLLDRVLVYGLLACIPALLGFAGDVWWPLELFSHFRVQYLLIGCFLLPLAAYRKKAWAGALALLLVLCNAPVIIQHQRRLLPEKKQESSHRALLFNMNADNQEFSAVRQLLMDTQPDLVVLIELRQAALNALDLQSLGFAHSLVKTQMDNFGIGLFSRFALVDGRVEFFGHGGLPSLVATVDFGDCRVQAVGTHPPPPIHEKFAQIRRSQLSDLAQFAAGNRARPFLVMMDMNTSPWSPLFSEFEARSGLYDSRRGLGLQLSWPSLLPMLLRIPIDHVFHSDRISIVDRKVEDFNGSDHAPVLVDFSCNG